MRRYTPPFWFVDTLVAGVVGLVVGELVGPLAGFIAAACVWISGVVALRLRRELFGHEEVSDDRVAAFVCTFWLSSALTFSVGSWMHRRVTIAPEMYMTGIDETGETIVTPCFTITNSGESRAFFNWRLTLEPSSGEPIVGRFVPGMEILQFIEVGTEDAARFRPIMRDNEWRDTTIERGHRLYGCIPFNVKVATEIVKREDTKILVKFSDGLNNDYEVRMDRLEGHAKLKDIAPRP